MDYSPEYTLDNEENTAVKQPFQVTPIDVSFKNPFSFVILYTSVKIALLITGK